MPVGYASGATNLIIAIDGVFLVLVGGFAVRSKYLLSGREIGHWMPTDKAKLIKSCQKELGVAFNGCTSSYCMVFQLDS